jgi:hypothetical protein
MRAARLIAFVLFRFVCRTATPSDSDALQDGEIHMKTSVSSPSRPEIP